MLNNIFALSKTLLYLIAMMITEDELLQQITTFCNKWQMRVTDFGMRAVGTPNFVGDLRKGGYSPQLKTAKRALDFMDHYELKKLNQESNNAG